MRIRTAASRGRTLVITEVDRWDDEPPSKSPPVLRVVTWRGKEWFKFRMQSDGIIHRGKFTLGTWGRNYVYSFVVIAHPSACSLFFVLQDPRDAPLWAQRYEGFWDDEMDEAIGIEPKLSDIRPATVEEGETTRKPPAAPLEVCEIGTIFRGDYADLIVGTLRDIGYRVEYLTWEQYHNGSFPWKTGGRRAIAAV